MAVAYRKINYPPFRAAIKNGISDRFNNNYYYNKSPVGTV